MAVGFEVSWKPPAILPNLRRLVNIHERFARRRPSSPRRPVRQPCRIPPAGRGAVPRPCCRPRRRRLPGPSGNAPTWAKASAKSCPAGRPVVVGKHDLGIDKALRLQFRAALDVEVNMHHGNAVRVAAEGGIIAIDFGRRSLGRRLAERAPVCEPLEKDHAAGEVVQARRLARGPVGQGEVIHDIAHLVRLGGEGTGKKGEGSEEPRAKRKSGRPAERYRGGAGGWKAARA